MRALNVPLLVLTVVALAMSAGAQTRVEPRVWTNDAGRQITASLVSADGVSVVLRMKGGRLATVPLASLSEEDRAHVAELEKLGLTIEVGVMPEEVKIDRDLEITGDDRVFETDHFRFETDRDVSKAFISEAARIFEATFAAVDQLPFGLNPKPPEGLDKFQARFLERVAFDAFLEEIEIDGPNPTPKPITRGAQTQVAGVYVPARREIVVPYSSIGARENGSQMTLRKSSDTSTLVHEITHQVMHDWLPITPIWFAEGFAEYMAMIPYLNGRFDFSRIESGLKEHLEKKYARSGQVPVASVPVGLASEEHLDDWNGGMDDYLGAMLTFYFLVHHRDEVAGKPIAAYLKVVDRAQTNTVQFLGDYNAAVADFEKRRATYNAEIERYNAEVDTIKQLIATYNAEVDAYNAAVRSGTGADALVPPTQPSYTEPVLPEELVLPEILAKQTGSSGPTFDLRQISAAEGRAALLQGESLSSLVDQMVAFYEQSSLPARIRYEEPPARRKEALPQF